MVAMVRCLFTLPLLDGIGGLGYESLFCLNRFELRPSRMSRPGAFVIVNDG